MELYQIEHQFAQRTIAMRGDAGRAWVAQIPGLIAGIARDWSLTVRPVFPNLSYNYVVSVERADGTPAVLKLGFPPDPEFRRELAALRHFGGHGMVRLLEADPARSAMLLERVIPGAPLATVADDAAATTIAANLLRDFWPAVPAEPPFPTIADWGQGFARMRRRFDGGSGPIPARLADQAERTYTELLASQAAPVLLHGDLHHDNILSGPDGTWRVIDPKGVIGEPAYELGAFLRNPGSLIERREARRLTERRIAIFAGVLGLAPDRILAWARAQAVLSAWWVIEDNAEWLDLALAFAELFESITLSDI